MNLNINLGDIPYGQQVQFYINHMHPLINKDALLRTEQKITGVLFRHPKDIR